MNRRHFLLCGAAAPVSLVARASDARIHRDAGDGPLLVLIDLVGGNDALNTVIPFSDPRYFDARPTIALDRRVVLPLDADSALHPALRSLMPLWQDGELAVVQGVGGADASLSHQRARELMDIGLPGGDPEPAAVDHVPTGVHTTVLRSAFPDTSCGLALTHACAQIAAGHPVRRIRICLHGFDTHENQLPEHSRLLAELAAAISALRNTLRVLGRWDDTLVMTRSEFGRRVAENLSSGTDHGSVGVQFLAGGRVAGGLHGRPPDLEQLDARGNPVPVIELSKVYDSVEQDWWRRVGGAPLAGLSAMPGLFVA